MEQHADMQPGPQWDTGDDDRASGKVSPAAVIGILVVTVLGGLLVLGNLVLAVAASIGPDSCGEVSCHGAGARAGFFVALAAVGGLTTMGTWFTFGSTRRTARYVLALIAVGVPLIGDVIILAGAPDWLT
jgi:hypothetical protein